MKNYQKEFIEFSLKIGVLKFGDFTLKSGRVSPYFFNTGLFNTGYAIASLGNFYAKTIIDSKINFDILFGPAYKGIPLSAVTTSTLYNSHNIDIPYAFNRKEKKDYGEGGNIVGHQLKGKVLIIDDVITAGTAIRESMNIINNEGAEAAGVILALDRQEQGNNGISAIQEIEKEYNIPIFSIAKLDDLITFLKQKNNIRNLEKIRSYRDKYGIK
tara:strand:- start:405 stop:1046 length:642 start_codon:yes stop_codon:yes gene_type:complete